MGSYRLRRFIAVLVVLLLTSIPLSKAAWQFPTLDTLIQTDGGGLTDDAAWPELSAMEVKGRAPKTGYERSQFGNGWDTTQGCTTRNRILARDLTNVVLDDECKVVSGTLNDPYTGKIIPFTKGEATSDDVQIDHVVALSNAWQTGAQAIGYAQRVMFANDPLNLLAVSGPANEQKSDSDAASWLPSNKSFRCTYVKRQLAVKAKYKLWLTPPEHDAMARILKSCSL